MASNKMLGRKQSMRGEITLADYGPDESLNENTDLEWVNKLWVRRLLRLCALLSLLSVSLNTTRTFDKYPALVYFTFLADAFVTLLFSAEMIAKMHIRGVIMVCLVLTAVLFDIGGLGGQGDNPYLKDRWCQFDATMVFFLWISVILQVFEMTGVVPKFSYLSILRAPRPLIMIRFIRVFLKFSMPKSRINQIFNNVTLADLAIPDTYCSNSSTSGYQCPQGMVCLELNLPKNISGFNGFDDFDVMLVIDDNKEVLQVSVLPPVVTLATAIIARLLLLLLLFW
ncbi:hypothetical protein LAZ67_2000326 [Cordylochernes scorpioides]|uniref:Ion transport domain-containing protein n=1 Tax=Cordylochernes scorpioides TaxID=51811 RepID=A0ABY6K0Q0_9ARAC|nr:hypothetical protein LAZ67_2000326 [Cordylochernes scorpioides]